MKPPREVDLLSALSRDQVVSRLRAETEEERFRLWFTIKPFWKPIIARVRGRKLRLRQHRNFGNSFGPFFYGDVTAVQHGTRLNGRFKMHPAVRASIALWFAMLGVFAFLGATQAPPGQRLVGSDWLVLAAMAVFAIGVIALGWLLGRNERRAIVQLLHDVMGLDQPD